MRRPIYRRAAMPLAALALAGALYTATAEAAPPVAVGENPAKRADGWFTFARTLPLPKSESLACKYRDPIIALKPGRYELTLHVRQAGREAKPKSQSFTVNAPRGRATGSTAGKFKWRDCFKRERVGDRMRFVHTAQLDRADVRGVDPVTGDVVQPIEGLPVDPDATDKVYELWSQLFLVKRAAKPTNPGNGPKPPARQSPPRAGGDDEPCDTEQMQHRAMGMPVQICPDWAPASPHRMPVHKTWKQSSPVIDYINPDGEDWYACQHRGEPYRMKGYPYRNNWWALTIGDKGKQGWVPETFFSGGDNGRRDGALRLC